jgi:hypothetical protein
LRSEEFDDAYWTKQNGAVTANTQVAPDGTTTADTLTSDGGSVTINKSGVVRFAATPRDGNIYAKSVFVKKGNTRYAWFSGLGTLFGNAQGIIFDFDDEVVTSFFNVTQADVKIVKLLNGWYRLSISILSSAGTNENFSVGMTNSPTTFLSHNSGDFVHIWGAQAELSSTASSYIPTVASTVTRVADAVSKTGISSLIGQTEGTIFLEFDFTNISGIQLLFSIHDSANNKRIEIWANNSILNGFIGGSVNITIGTLSISYGRHKAALAYKQSGDQAFYIDGVQIGTSATAYTIAALTALIYDYWGGGFHPTVRVRQTALSKTRLSNAQLEALTSL